jgi:hypothetical protein
MNFVNWPRLQWLIRKKYPVSFRSALSPKKEKKISDSVLNPSADVTLSGMISQKSCKPAFE